MTFIRIAGRTGHERGTNFEHAITNYLIKKGYKIDPKNLSENRYSHSGYEVDFRGKLENTPVIVECKAHKGKIDLPLIAAFYGKYSIERRKNEHCKGIFFSLSPLTDAAKLFYESIQKSEENIPFEVITTEGLIENLMNLPDNPPLEADYGKVKREYERIVEEYNLILNYNYKVGIEDKENKIFLEYINESYYWICITTGNYFLILDKKAELPKNHKYLAEQLKETENFLKNSNYLLAEKAELNPKRLLEMIIFCERNDEWKYVFKTTIELLSEKGCLDILIELLNNPRIRATVSVSDVIYKIEDVSEKLQRGIKNWREEFSDVAYCCIELLNFALEFNIRINKNNAVKNLKDLIKIYSKILVFDKDNKSEHFEKISYYIEKLVELNGEKVTECFDCAYKSSKEALKILNSELKQDVEDKDIFISKFAESDYFDPDLFSIELYEYQIKLLTKAHDEDNDSWIENEISELNNKINELHLQMEYVKNV